MMHGLLTFHCCYCVGFLLLLCCFSFLSHRVFSWVGCEMGVVSLHCLGVYVCAPPPSFLNKPMRYIPPFEDAFKEYIRSNSAPDKHPSPKLVYHIGFSGSFGSNRVNPRTLIATFLGKMVCVEGIVTKCSLVRPKVVTRYCYCCFCSSSSSSCCCCCLLTTRIHACVLRRALTYTRQVSSVDLYGLCGSIVIVIALVCIVCMCECDVLSRPPWSLSLN
jgi:hypothetical protein